MIIAPFVSVLIFAILVTNCFGVATYGETKSVAVSEGNLQSYVDDYDNNNTTDKFGTKKMYPTSEGGMEWYIDMINPKSDGIFSITDNYNITKQTDGSWRIDVPMVRMNVITPPGAEPWKNIEITGYLLIILLLLTGLQEGVDKTPVFHVKVRPYMVDYTLMVL